MAFWWIARKKVRRIYLPTIAIIELSNKQLPKLQVTQPPWLSFVLFSVLSCLIALLYFRPYLLEFKNEDKKQQRLHVFVDLSPSISASTNIDELKAKLKEIIGNLAKERLVTLSHSQQTEIIEDSSTEHLNAQIEKMTFHRGGLRLGEILDAHLKKLGKVDAILIVSDRDKHSWNGFDWQYLAEQMPVYLYNLSEGANHQKNIFIKSAFNILRSGVSQQNWNLIIARNDSGQVHSGILVAKYNGKEMAKTDFSFPKDKNEIEIQIDWMQDLIKNDEPIIFEIIAAPDANIISIDDQFFAQFRQQANSAASIGGIKGEQYLRDASYHFNKIIGILGMKTRNFEKYDPKMLQQFHPKLVSIFFDGILESKMYCPQPKDLRESSLTKSMVHLWLIPDGKPYSTSSLCECFVQLKYQESANQHTHLCADVKDRQPLIDFLVAMGAVQLGGSVEDRAGAIAYHLKLADFEVTTFTVPLQPNLNFGLDHGSLPFIVKQVALWSKLIEDERMTLETDWARYEDISRIIDKEQEEFSYLIQRTNVPVAESLLNQEAFEDLPPLLNLNQIENPLAIDSGEPHKNPEYILMTVTFLAIAILLLEAFLYFLLKLRPRLTAWIASIYFLILFASADGRLFANTEIIEFSKKNAGIFTNLAGEVEDRTSIELNPTAKNYSDINSRLLESPWIWVSQDERITDANGAIRSEFLLWLRKGGFLVLENVANTASLEKLFPERVNNEFMSRWQIIPPDHELMRSFYLIDSLPTCASKLWYGYSFDGRIAVLALPFSLLEMLKDNFRESLSCLNPHNREVLTRTFVNIMMVALATDYKKDQIHLPEILKRLR